jgi:glucosamine-6-phosphate deaminase
MGNDDEGIREILKTGKNINILDDRTGIYESIAGLMADTIKKNNEYGRTTSFILPVGPRGQYRRFAALCNSRRISCRNLVTVNMDEFLDMDDNYISMSNLISFRGFMKENLFDLLDSDLAVKPENIYFPDPENPGETGRLIKELGGADICFSGVGINGHIAFNEPVGHMSIEEFMDLETRVLDVSRDTIIITSLKYNGFVDLIPRRCITIGMKEIAASKKINIYLEHPHQAAALHKILYGKPSSRFPVTLITRMEKSGLFVTREVVSGVSNADRLRSQTAQGISLTAFCKRRKVNT